MTPIAANCDRRPGRGPAKSTRFALPSPKDLDAEAVAFVRLLSRDEGTAVRAVVIHSRVSIVREKLSWQPWPNTRRPASMPWEFRLIASVA